MRTVVPAEAAEPDHVLDAREQADFAEGHTEGSGQVDAGALR